VPIAVIGAVIISGIIYVVGSYALVTAFGVGRISVLAGDPNPFHTAAKAFIPFVAPLITWIFLTSVTSSYVAANTQTSRVIFAGARGGLWIRSLAGVSPRFHTPAAAAVAFVAPSIAIGVISTAFTDPAIASGFLFTFGILGLVIMYLAANVALIVDWARLRRRGVHKNPWLWVVVPVIGVAVLAIPVWGDLRPGQASPFNTLPWLTIALIAAGIIYALVLARLRPRVLEQAPRCSRATTARTRPRTRWRSPASPASGAPAGRAPPGAAAGRGACPRLPAGARACIPPASRVIVNSFLCLVPGLSASAASVVDVLTNNHIR
jgi:amino acid transporter